MDDVHRAIAVGLANELRVFCKDDPSFREGDWYMWDWDSGSVSVRLLDGQISVMWSQLGAVGEPILECDLGHPDLVELLRSALSRG